MLKNLSLQTLFSISLLFLNSQLTANDAPIILPGAPGEESKNLDAEDATNMLILPILKLTSSFFKE